MTTTYVRPYIYGHQPDYTRKWFPLQGELTQVSKYVYFLIKNKSILVHSMLAAGIVQDTIAGEGEGGEEETTGGYFYCYFYWYILPLRLQSLPFLSS